MRKELVVQLFHLAFVSKATVVVDDNFLKSLQAVSQLNNAANGITGLTLYSGGYFIQLLEGDTVKVAETFARIVRDSRHTDIRCVLFGPATTRLYPGMAHGVLNMRAASGEIDPQRIWFLLNLDKHEHTVEARRNDIISVFEEFRAQVEADALNNACVPLGCT